MLNTLPSQYTIEEALKMRLQAIRPNPDYVERLKIQLRNAKDIIIEKKPVVLRTMCAILAVAGSFALATTIVMKLLGKK